MAFDGITTNCLMQELNQVLAGQKISKIAQPEREELLFTFKGVSGPNRLLISANASLPFLYLTKENKTSPMTAPNFCMLLRKHISNGRIISITQPSLERVLKFTIEHLDELGDPSEKHLYVELMGKHSNIIFCDENDVILDSIKHVSAQVSSVREVLPGRPYFIPTQDGKVNPWETVREDFIATVFSKPMPLSKAIYTSHVGFSPVIATELAHRSGLDSEASTSSFTENEKQKLFETFDSFMHAVENGEFTNTIYYQAATGAPMEFAPVSLSIYDDADETTFDTMSELLEAYYAQKNKFTNIRQKSVDLRKIVSIHLERDRKKYQLQKKQLEDTEKKDKYRIYGEMLHTYGYQAAPGAKKLTVINYYNNEELTIPLDDTRSAMDNATKYFDKYAKLKRTSEALSDLIQDTQNEIAHLESISASLDIAENDADLNAIKEELQDFGFIKKHYSNKKKAKTKKSKPLHFIDKNGFHMYVGKNNYQNDMLTFKFATGNDWWFHTKGIPGSHVIVKSEGAELPDETFETAAALAAYYSSGRDNNKVEIDYLQKKNVKKPSSAAPGFVIYYTNFSMMTAPSLANVTLLQ